ncbi:unnamed protein product, partial [Acidithrix sp. C25]
VELDSCCDGRDLDHFRYHVIAPEMFSFRSRISTSGKK